MTSEEKAEALAAFEARQNERRSNTVSLKTEWLKAWEAGRELLRTELNDSSDKWRFAAVGAVEANLKAERERSVKLQAELDHLIKMQG